MITLALMVLLTVMVVGLLSLLSVSLRQAAQSQNQAVARANARLALQLAIGELQRTLGPDQRVSVPADALAIAPLVVHAHWQNATGVLKHTDDARLPLNEAPAAKVKREFMGWLVSGDPASTSLLGSAASAAPAALLLMKGKTPESDVHAAAVTIADATTQGPGRYAWWAEDVGTKVSVGLARQTDSTLAVLAPDRFDVRKIGGLEAAPAKGSAQWDRLPTTNTSELVLANARTITRSAGRPLTAVHRGVLADVANGRLKRDLTVALGETKANMESWIGQKIYAPPGGAGDPGGPHWEQLREYFQSGTNGALTVRRQTADQQGYYPVIAGVTEIYGISNTMGYAPSGVPIYAADYYNKLDGNGNATSNVMAFHMSPVIKLWNPYDRPLQAPNGYTLAVANGNARYATGAADYDQSYQDQIGWGRNGATPVVSVRPPKTMRYEHRYFIPAVTIGPGETKIFALSANRFLDIDGTYIAEAGKSLGAKTNVQAAGWILGDLTDVTDSGGCPGYSFWDLNFTKQAFIALADRERWNYTGGRSEQQAATGGDIQLLDTINTAGLQFSVKPHPFTTWCIRLFEGKQKRPSLNPSGTYNPDPEAPLVNIRNINTNTTGFSKNFVPIVSNSNPTTEPFFLNPSGQASCWARRCVLKLAENEGDGNLALYNPQNGKTKDAKWLANYNPRSPTVGCWGNEHARPVSDGNFTGLPSSPLQVNGTNNAAPYGMGTPGNYLSGMLASFTSSDAMFLNKAIGYSDVAGPEKTVLFQTPPANHPEKYFFSIGQLGHANLWIENGTYEADVKTKGFATEDWFAGNLHPAYPIGNSYADPRLKLALNQGRFQNLAIVDAANTHTSTFHDLSYYLNRSLWDSYFFSARKDGAGLSGSYNSRLEARSNTTLPGGKSGFDNNAANLLLAGAFNINSTNPDAWAAFLASLCDVSVGNAAATANAAYPRTLPPLGAEVSAATAGNNISQYTGFRALTSAEVKDLAVKIVAEIKLRGPSTSLADFINRAVSTGSPLDAQIKGLLQAAIDKTTINTNHQGASSKYTIPESDVDSNYEKKAFAGDLAAGVPGYLTQADLLTRLGHLVSPRSDTFVIRCRGEALDKTGKVVLATALCEATVQRLPEYVDRSVDAATQFTALPATSAAKTFGRAFAIVSFRWLNLQQN